MKIKKVLFSLMAALCCFTMSLGTACGGNNTDGSSSSVSVGDSSTDSGADGSADSSGDTGAVEFPTVNAAELVDFTVDVPVGRDPVVLMLSDTQFIDAAQQRRDDRLGGLTDRYSRANIEDRVLRYIREAVTRANPDLILIAGDVTYGEFDDSGYALQLLVECMESFQIPWAPIMGNHEGETPQDTSRAETVL